MIRYVPRLPTHLLTRDIPLGEAGLILLEAGPGAGKTTLAAQWAARNRELEGAWIGIGPGLHRQEFWRMIARLVDHPEHPGFAGDGPGREALVRWAGDRGELTLILRDAQYIREPEWIADLVAVVRGCPGLRVIALGSDLGGLARAADDANLDFSRLRAGDLHFSPEQTRAYFALLGVADPAAAEAELRTVLGGHPGAIRLAARALAEGGQHAPNGRDALIEFSLLRARSESSSTEEYARFLSLALPEKLPLALAEVLVDGRAGALALLPGLTQPGNRPATGPMQEDILVLDPAARARMTTELQRDHRVFAEEASRRLVVWKMTHNLPGEALTRAVSSGNYELASEVVWRNFNELTAEHGALLRDRLREILLLRIRRFPVLCMALALVYNANGHTRLRSAEYFTLAVTGVRGRYERASISEKVILSSIQAAAYRVLGRFPQALRAVREADVRIAELPAGSAESLGSILPLLFNHNAITHLYAGDTARALELLAASLAATPPRQLSDPYHGLSLTAGVYAVLGDMDAAAASLRELDALPPFTGNTRIYLTTLGAVARAALELERFDTAAAREHIHEYLPEIETSEHWGGLVEILVLCDLIDGRRSDALLRLETRMGARRQPAITRVLRTRLSVLQADLELGAGNVARADRLTERLDRGLSCVVLFHARRDLLMGEHRRAAVALAGLNSAELSPRERALCHLLFAVALAGSEEAESAVAELGNALLTLREWGLSLPLLQVPRGGLERLVDLAAEHSDPASAAALAALLDTLPAVWARETPRVQLSARELLVLEHIARGLSVAETAAELTVSQNTVKTQTRSLFRKLDVGNRRDAVMRAASLGILTPEDPA
ncbi:LuxR C-terminal-related transcriptional regulator [Mycetocola spongiae]|uniref:LuxR C-terminal-related transcriptional regulator n=1 Tax=Mycetocola spongiae TaxID=2859226 RepID=UPI001CF2D117|nr:LuxR C-terminal-related transcriptional regulator [Mycetocola spongiae]UCR88018.1 LuxR C-terminal-related transcriptional regulator [Mycetocola spongiae]